MMAAPALTCDNRSVTTCSIDGCDGRAGVPGAGRGWCRSHYKRWYRYGDPEAPLRRVHRYDTACTVDDCDTEVYGLGLCELHYARTRRRGTVELIERVDPGCVIDGCDATHYGRDLCRRHYDQTRGPRPGGTPEQAAFRARRRYNRKRNAPGSHTLAEWAEKLAGSGGWCAYCPAPADTRDHVIPITRGGTDDIDNLAPACRPCNSSKGTLTVAEWLARR